MLDKNRLRDDANCIIVAEALGIPVTKRGNRNLILCPDHADRRVGSCLLSEKGYYCYSCHGKGNVFDLVMKSKEVSFQEAAEMIAEICGGKEHYQIDKNKVSKHNILPYQYQKLIGLIDTPVYKDYFFRNQEECEEFLEEHPGTVAKTIFDNFPEDNYSNNTEDVLKDPIIPIAQERIFGYSVSVLCCSSPLSHLYSTSRSEYYRLVREHCLSAMETTKSIYEAVISVSKNPMEIIGVYKKKLDELNYVLERYGTDPLHNDDEPAPIVTISDVPALGHALNQSLNLSLSKLPF